MSVISTLFVKLVADVQSYISDMEKAGKKTEGTGTSIKGMATQALAAVGGVTALAAATRQVITNTMDYDKEVRDLSRDTGMSADEASRLIQTFDDLDVESSVLHMSLKKLSDEGITMTVEKMAELSDVYLSLSVGAERNNFLIKEFGKSGLDMAKAMAAGGDAIRRMAAEQKGGLVLTQEQIDKSRQLEIAQDSLNDSMQALTMTLGNWLIPKLVDAANAYEHLQSDTQTFMNLLNQHRAEVAKTAVSYADYAEELNRAARAAGYYVDVEGRLVTGKGQLVQENYRLSESDYNAVRAGEAVIASDKMLQMGMNDLTQQEKKNITTTEQMTNANQMLSFAQQGVLSTTDQLANATRSLGSAQNAVTKAQDDLKATQEAWRQNEGNQLLQYWDKWLPEASKKEQQAMQIVDAQTGTNTFQTYQYNRQLYDLTHKFQLGQIDAKQYADGIGQIQTQLMPTTTPMLDAASAGLADIKAKIDEILAIGGVDISVRVTSNGGGSSSTSSAPSNTPPPGVTNSNGHDATSGGGKTSDTASGGGKGLVPERAKGGFAGGLTVVGEEGPEIVELPEGSMVHSNPDSKRILSAFPHAMRGTMEGEGSYNNPTNTPRLEVASTFQPSDNSEGGNRNESSNRADDENKRIQAQNAATMKDLKDTVKELSDNIRKMQEIKIDYNQLARAVRDGFQASGRR